MDGSAGGRRALAWALSAAAGRGASLEVVSAFPVDVHWIDPLLVDPHRIEKIRRDVEARTRDLVEEVRSDPEVSAIPGTAEVPVWVMAAPGPAAPVLVHRAEGAELLVVGSRGRGGVRSTVLGSVALHCSVHAPCPVVVVRSAAGEAATEPATAPRVVVGLDDSPHAEAALRAALAEADRRGGRVEAVLAYDTPNYWSDMYAVMTAPPGRTREQALERAEAFVADALGDEAEAVDVVVADGPPGEVLVQHAVGAVLLVVGSRSRSTLAGMVLGSVALHCVIHGPCPVMVVRPEPEPARDRSAGAAEPAPLG